MFSNSGKYAIRAVLYLALNTDERHKMKAEDIAKALSIPKAFLAKILQQLNRSKMVSSAKGRNGGFYLSEENRANNLLQVIEAIDGPTTLNNCILGLENCSDQVPCPYHEAVSGFRKEFYLQLRNENIDACSKRINFSKLRLINKDIF